MLVNMVSPLAFEPCASTSNMSWIDARTTPSPAPLVMLVMLESPPAPTPSDVTPIRARVCLKLPALYCQHSSHGWLGRRYQKSGACLPACLPVRPCLRMCPLPHTSTWGGGCAALLVASLSHHVVLLHGCIPAVRRCSARSSMAAGCAGA